MGSRPTQLPTLGPRGCLQAILAVPRHSKPHATYANHAIRAPPITPGNDLLVSFLYDKGTLRRAGDEIGKSPYR